MDTAGYVLTGMRKCRPAAHPPMILFHSLKSDFFGIDERAAQYPDFECFNLWPASARLLWKLHQLDRMAGQSSVSHFGHWFDPVSRRVILCTRHEAKRKRFFTKHSHICVKQ